MSLWFSATAAAPELAAEWGLTDAETAWLTVAVQLGFVVGALLSSALTLSDVLRPRHLVAGSAVAGAVCTATIAAVVETALPAIALRFLTGVALAGVYPPGMKLLAGWFEAGRGFAIGTLVGALTVGSALPHLIRAIGGVGQPRVVLYGAAGLATVGGLLVLLVEPGPYQAPAAPFDPSAIGRILRDRGTMLANGGYFGHMWELYAVWTWIPAYLVASIATNGGDDSSGLASLLAFGTIGVGGVGAIVADSAQFSAAVSELAEGSYVGTALTLQTAIGLLLTTVSIQLLPVVVDAVGWRWAFAPLAVGPLVGTLSMQWLRRLPEAAKLAGGRG